MLEKQHHPVAFDITQRVKVHDKQILFVCNSDKEAQFLKNELLLFFETVLVSPIKEDNPLPNPFLLLNIPLMLPLQNSILEPRIPL